MEIRIATVIYDTDGNLEPSILGYQLYRYEENLSAAPVLVSGQNYIPQPSAGILYATFIDTDPLLRPHYGETLFYYRAKCVDSNSNVSAHSAAVSAKLDDITPPSPPVNVSANGFNEFIKVQWQLNPETDISEYRVYRSLCDLGSWVCDKAEMQKQTWDLCPDVFKYLGSITQEEAIGLAAEFGAPFYEDRTVPSESPLCYAYLVKAVDYAQNQSGFLPPNLDGEIVVCQRLRDSTPPEPAVITGLSAQNGKILVEWVGSPIQDIAAYHVYRSEAENGPYTWVGGSVALGAPAPLTEPFTPPDEPSCETIPIDLNEDMSLGSFLDQSAKPKQVYWYKVLGIDQVGNESLYEAAVPVSTFTFSVKPIQLPVIAVAEDEAGCGLTITWTPTFNSSKQQGFAVYRSLHQFGQYLQISDLVTGNEYIDRNIAQGVSYWYRVLLINAEGEVSELSPAKRGIVLPPS